MPDGQVVFEIKGDNSGIKSTLSDTTAAIKEESSKWDDDVRQSSNDIQSALESAFDTERIKNYAIQLGKELLKFIGNSINIASSLEEVQNVVDVTFGPEGAQKIETWAKTARSQFGLSELQAKTYTSTIGAMLKSSGVENDKILDMSTGIAGLTADMASFYNLDYETAFMKIRSGLSGEIEPLRQLGISMSVANLEAYALSQGITASYEDMDEAQKVMLRYSYLMHVTADAQGDFTRTSDSYANSQRRIATSWESLQADLGNILLPMATQVSNAVADLLELLTSDGIETAFDQADEAISGSAETATKAQGILGYMDKLYERYGEAATKTQEWATALEELKKVMPEVNQFINEETGELTASNEELRTYIENSKQAAIEKAKATAMGALSQQIVETGQAYYTSEIRRDMATEQANAAWDSLVSYIASKPGHEDFTGEGMSIEQLQYAAQATANEFGESQKTIQEWVNIYKTQTDAANGFQREMDTLSAKLDSLQADYDIAQKALERMSKAAETAATNLSGISSPTVGMNSGQYYNYIYGHHAQSQANGIEHVPYDGYLALLHQGERVQTAAEVDMSRRYSNQQPGFDYGAFGNAMWENAPSLGGNVYLDGQTVGRVISSAQADLYRAMERSGYQA